jgi:Protein of unknown function (DUF3309)
MTQLRAETRFGSPLQQLLLRYALTFLTVISQSIACSLGIILIVVVLVLLLGGGGHYGYSRYGGSGLGGALGLVLVVLLVLWFFGGLHLQR